MTGGIDQDAAEKEAQIALGVESVKSLKNNLILKQRRRKL